MRNSNKRTVRLNESDLVNLVAEVAKRMIKENMFDTPYGPVSNNPLKPTFDDKETQDRLTQDTVNMLSSLPLDRFMCYWNKRMSFDDPDLVDAIYHEYYERHKRGEM